MTTSRQGLMLLLLASCLVVSGCATATWTDRTETTRPLAPAEVRHERAAIADHWHEMVTDAEEDGFEIRHRLQTSERGRMRVNLLPVALQSIAYGGDVTMRFYDESVTEVHASTLTLEEAYDVIAEWRVQVTLGAKPELRRAVIGLMNELIRESPDHDLVQDLRKIRENTQVRPEWR
jgi:hypothetical protein